MLEQNDVWVAKGMGSMSFEQLENDCVIMYKLPTVAMDSNVIAPPRHAVMSASTSTPLHFDTTSPALPSATKSLRAIMESQQLVVLMKNYNIHFKKYSNGMKKKGHSNHTIYRVEESLCHLYPHLF